MGWQQTKKHRNGKGSYHQIGLVRGQFGDVRLRRMDQISAVGRLRRLGRSQLGTRSAHNATPTPVPRRMPRNASIWPGQHGLEIFTVATHLQGQVLGDEPSAKTLQFLQRRGRSQARLQGLALQGQQAAAHRSVFRPR